MDDNVSQCINLTTIGCTDVVFGPRGPLMIADVFIGLSPFLQFHRHFFTFSCEIFQQLLHQRNQQQISVQRMYSTDFSSSTTLRFDICGFEWNYGTYFHDIWYKNSRALQRLLSITSVMLSLFLLVPPSVKIFNLSSFLVHD